MEDLENIEPYPVMILMKKVMRHKNMINVCEKYKGMDAAEYHIKDSTEKIQQLENAILILKEHGF